MLEAEGKRKEEDEKNKRIDNIIEHKKEVERKK